MNDQWIYDHEIATVEDVRRFFSYLASELKLNFHPDTDFSEYVSAETGRRSFTDEQISHYNTLMEACFDICELSKADIYEIGLRVLRGKVNV